jgi:predicted DNA-binding helix-hairpin-helix protein
MAAKYDVPHPVAAIENTNKGLGDSSSTGICLYTEDGCCVSLLKF